MKGWNAGAARGHALLLHQDAAALQQMAGEHQAIVQRGLAGHRLHIARVLVGPCKLQPLGNDQSHAVHLLGDRVELGTHGRGAITQQHARQVEVALDHRDGVVHLMRDAGGELAHRGHLLAALQPALCGQQLSGALLQRLGAVDHLGIELGGPALQRGSLVGDGVARCTASAPISSPLRAASTRARSAPASTKSMVRAICSSGPKICRARRADSNAATIITPKNTTPMPATTPDFSQVKGRSRQPTKSMPTGTLAASASRV